MKRVKLSSLDKKKLKLSQLTKIRTRGLLDLSIILIHNLILTTLHYSSVCPSASFEINVYLQIKYLLKQIMNVEHNVNVTADGVSG